LIFWKLKKSELVPRIPFSLSYRFFALRRPPEYSRTASCQKIGSGRDQGKLGRERGVGWLDDF